MKMFRLIILFLLVFAVSPLLFAQTATTAQEGPIVGYKEGLFIESPDGNNRVQIQGRLQARFTYNSLEKTTDTNTFVIQRGKIKLDGNVFSKALLYVFEMSFGTRAAATTSAACANAACTSTVNAVTAESTTGLPALEDYYVDWTKYDLAQIRTGQFKVPFLRQELTSDGKQQFVDRASSTDFFNFSRDLGVTLHGYLFNYWMNYYLFAMNGEGQNNVNRNRNLLTGLRLEFPLLGNYKYSESDVDYSALPTLGFGAATVYNERASSFSNGTIPATTKAQHGTVDVDFKYHGLSWLAAGMVNHTLEGASVTNWGYNSQLGYFLLPQRFEVAARAAGTIFKTLINQYEYAFALNTFFNKHSLKLQTDYAFLINNRGQNLNDHRIRTQLQVVF
ncbi:MAG: hypothetical protein A3I05_08825 [Deltaproteobacteria bacterium RIFCSPLOWO2_02_FULL_44_10]|nr:MAG: hypothetical protein A3C46_02355 [Deltaproteobacteria bacterium RIFCSPHIGHO2_02_FULL_44_16]OGQ45797.1 MAG: hypothetical protein A3I05_08825 [Deltaproteobacteria bacterium RIFCSPLOWO2_02_FULL_44_10]